MKRLLILVLLAALLLTGCNRGEKPEDTVTFYYLRSEITYGTGDGVIAPEERELTAGEPSLSELLTLYLQGPVTETLLLPLPAGTGLTNVHTGKTIIILTFSSELSELSGLDLSIACACIAGTCFSLTEADTVRIEAPGTDHTDPVDYTVTRSTFLLYDDTTVEADAS